MSTVLHKGIAIEGFDFGSVWIGFVLSFLPVSVSHSQPFLPKALCFLLGSSVEITGDFDKKFLQQ